MDGVELIAAVKGISAGVECVIVSAYSDFEAARKAIEHQASGYILKPLEEAEVRKAALRVKARLDARTGDPLLLDPNDKRSAGELAERLERLIKHPWLQAALFADSPGLGRFPAEIHVKGASVRAVLVSSPGRDIPPAGAFPADCAWSRRHEGCGGVLEMLREAQAAGCGNFSFAAHQGVSDIQYHIALHFREPFSLGDLASRFAVSENYLGELFKKHGKDTVVNFTRKLRLYNACRLLEHSDMPPKEVSGECGFSDAGYFGRVFRKHFGITPALFRARYYGGNHFRPDFSLF
jgi:two-component system response regulator YesN